MDRPHETIKNKILRYATKGYQMNLEQKTEPEPEPQIPGISSYVHLDTEYGKLIFKLDNQGPGWATGHVALSVNETGVRQSARFSWKWTDADGLGTDAPFIFSKDGRSQMVGHKCFFYSFGTWLWNGSGVPGVYDTFAIIANSLEKAGWREIVSAFAQRVAGGKLQ